MVLSKVSPRNDSTRRKEAESGDDLSLSEEETACSRGTWRHSVKKKLGMLMELRPFHLRMIMQRRDDDQGRRALWLSLLYDSRAARMEQEGFQPSRNYDGHQNGNQRCFRSSFSKMMFFIKSSPINHSVDLFQFIYAEPFRSPSNSPNSP